MKILNLIVYYGNKILKFIGVIILLAIFMSITAGIISRYIFNAPLSWTEEISCLMMVYLCYVSAALTTIEKKHIVADFFIAKAPEGFKRFVSILSRILMIVFFVVVVCSTLQLLPTLVWRSAVLDIPRKYYYLPVWTMSIFMAYTVAVDILNDIFHIENIMDEENARAAKEEQRKEREETEKIQQDMDSFMREAGYQVNNQKGDEKK